MSMLICRLSTSFHSYCFSETAPLFRKLYLEEQIVDALSGGATDSRDAPLFTIMSRITDPTRVDYVRDAIIAEIERMKSRGRGCFGPGRHEGAHAVQLRNGVE